jgi:isopentenyldiphosphate isomerase
VGTSSREECHANQDVIHRAVHFTLIDRNRNRVFVTRRSLNKDHDAGKYCFLGEHMLAGESYPEAVNRGVHEELGYEPVIFHELAHNIFSYQSQTEFVRFFVIDWKIEEIKWDKREIESVLWLDIGELKKKELDFSEMTSYWIDIVDWDSI